MLLERSLVFTFVMHGLGMVAMALFLLPGMPGGGTADDAARVAYIATHPWLWRLGWLPWQLTAVSDLVLSFALLRTAWVPRVASAITLAVTIAAVIPDQYGQIAWITKGIALAQAGDTAAYLAYERQIFAYTAAWGGSLYTLGALGWTWCFAAGGAWSRRATVLSAVLWPLFAVATLGPLFDLDAKIVAASNAVGFVLLQVWFVVVADLAFRRRRAEGAPGPSNLYEQVLAGAWPALPAALRAMHLPGEARGVFSMRWGESAPARLAARALRLPRPGEKVQVHLAVAPVPGGLSWTRRMGNDVLATEQTLHRGLLSEALGPLELGFRVTSDGRTIDYQQAYAGLRFLDFRVPLPRWLSPRVSAIAKPHEEDATIEVEIRAPLVGRLLRYEGVVKQDGVAERGAASTRRDGA